ncbi:origin recognition complex subunit 1 [Armigeres subalbatus]|uniref:origin recognition complex subunit 1 n=1 Tax=Armigeres subalbatus TaxID=124917 RepID=UPI002ED20EAC
MKKKINNNHSRISWIGAPYDPQIEQSFSSKELFYYKKCIAGALTLKIGDCVLVRNSDKADSDSIEGCDVARILFMYEIIDDTHDEVFKAKVQWYSWPKELPKYIAENENYIFDYDYEVFEDCRFGDVISIDNILGLCKVEIVECDINASEFVARKTHKLPMYVARYKLEKKPDSSKWQLGLLKGGATKHETPRKRKSIVQQSYRSGSVSKEIQNTPKLRLTRSKSIECSSREKNSELQNVLNEDNWVAKVIKDVDYSSYKKNLTHVTEGICGVELSDQENTSPTKMARLNSAKRKSGHFRRNLNASLRGGSPTSEEDLMNYSIIEDDSKNNNLKIKLRISERQKPKCGSPVTRSSMKREMEEENVPIDIETSPRKIRKPEEPQQTPTRPRRKSILKTPSTKTVEAVGTPIRNVQLSNIVEEFTEGRRVSRRITRTPKKLACDVEEPRTPRSRTGAKTTTQSTPSSASKMKLIRSGAIKPKIDSRTAAVEIATDNPLAMARERLHVSAVPTSLPCREKEYNEIYNFVEGKIIDGCGGCMYVSGVPGTGKTATTTAVIRSLQATAEDEEIPKFEFVEINGMRLTEPRQAYVHIYRQLTGKTLAWEQAYNLLEKRFTTKAPRRVTTVLLVDELDILCNRRQDVVYNLLNWPTLSSAQLVVITIANTMDLPERLLMGKISSRLGLTRLTFQPYNFRQLQEIVMARLTGTSAFDAEAVQLVARKVAAVSGDARRALDICRRATEIADDKSKQIGKFVSVSMVHVQQALAEMIASAKVQTIKSCSKLEQLFLQAVTSEVTRTGIEECSFLGVYTQYESLAAFAGIKVPNPGRAIAICSRLGASRLLICENSRNDIYQKILLNISADDVHYALQACSLI